MAINSGYPRILSRPLKIYWAGWETTTWQLQKCGWSLSAYQDIQGSRLQLAFRHGGLMLEGITSVIPFQYERTMDLRERDYIDRLVLGIERMIGETVLVRQTSIGGVSSSFSPIDAEQRYTEEKITRLEDLAHFAGSLIRTNEIIVPEESVPELLERIIKLQQPDRIERIKEELRGERRPEQKFHAQIISLRA